MSSSNSGNDLFPSSNLKFRLGGYDFIDETSILAAYNQYERWGYISDQERGKLAEKNIRTGIVKRSDCQGQPGLLEQELQNDYFDFTNPAAAPLTYAEMFTKWVTSSRFSGQQDLPEYDLFDKHLQGPLEDMMTFTIIPMNIFVLGLPSLQIRRYEPISFRQHIFAHFIVNYIINRIFNNYLDAGAGWRPRIWIDTTHLTALDVDFLRSKYQSYVNPSNPSEEPLWKMECGHLSYIMLNLRRRSNFLIMFKPFNPIRQMLESYLGTNPECLPEGIICAPWEITNEIPHDWPMTRKYFCGDQTSDLVRDWLGQLYRMREFTGPEINAGGKEIFGKTCLHLRADLWPSSSPDNPPVA